MQSMQHLLMCLFLQVSNRLLQLGVGLGGVIALVLLIADPVWPRTFTQVRTLGISLVKLCSLSGTAEIKA
jgi:Na+-transporting NADH:ubiquinone oxidoreductase subunit NqrE